MEFGSTKDTKGHEGQEMLRGERRRWRQCSVVSFQSSVGGLFVVGVIP